MSVGPCDPPGAPLTELGQRPIWRNYVTERGRYWPWLVSWASSLLSPVTVSDHTDPADKLTEGVIRGWKCCGELRHFIIVFQAFKSMRQRVNMSPVSLSVPVGSVRQRWHPHQGLSAPRSPRKVYHQREQRRAHTCSCVYTHTEGLFKLLGCNTDRAFPLYHSHPHYLPSDGANDTKTTSGEVTGIRWSCLLSAALTVFQFTGGERQNKRRFNMWWELLPIHEFIAMNFLNIEPEAKTTVAL